MPTSPAARDQAIAAYASRVPGGLAGVASDTVMAALDRISPSLQIRHITFRLGTHELYLVTPESSQGRWAGLIIPGQGDVEVTMWHRGAPVAQVRCDGEGVAVFPDVSPGPVRFVFRRHSYGFHDTEVEVQTEWVLIL